MRFIICVQLSSDPQIINAKFFMRHVFFFLPFLYCGLLFFFCRVLLVSHNTGDRFSVTTLAPLAMLEVERRERKK